MLDIILTLISLYQNSINSVNLEQCCTKIDLGIRIDSKLTFSLHVADVVAKSKQRLYMIFRAFSTQAAVMLTRPRPSRPRPRPRPEILASRPRPDILASRPASRPWPASRPRLSHKIKYNICSIT